MEIIKRLEELNFRFYEHFAADFDQTRSYGWAGWTPLLDLLPTLSELKVVDIGCGNGRLAQFLARKYCTQKNNCVRQYVGLDRSPSLLDYAKSIDLPFGKQIDSPIGKSIAFPIGKSVDRSFGKSPDFCE